MPWDEFVGMLTECQARGFGESLIRARAGRRARIRDSRGAGGRRSVSVPGLWRTFCRSGGEAVRAACRGVSRRGRFPCRFAGMGNAAEGSQIEGECQESCLKMPCRRASGRFPTGVFRLCGKKFPSLRQEIFVFAAGNFRLSAKKFVFVRMAFCIFAECGLQICGFWRIFMRNDTQTGRFSGFCGAGKRPLPAILSVSGEGGEVCPGTVRNEIKIALNL